MKKRLLAILLSFFISQAPAFAVWVGHDDFTKMDSKPNDKGEYHSTAVRLISVHFTREKPDKSRYEIGKGKLDFIKKTRDEAENEINSLFVSRYIELEFNQVKNEKHLNFIKNVLQDFDFDNGGAEVISFHSHATAAIRLGWEKSYQQLRYAHEQYLEEQAAKKRKREKRKREFEDFSESQGAGFRKDFPDSDDDY